MRMTYAADGKLVPGVAEHVAALAIALDVQGVEFTRDKRKWSAQGETIYAVSASYTGDISTLDEATLRKVATPIAARNHRLYLPPLRSDFAYAVALHELGHVATGENEVKAWMWAYDTALYWSPLMLRTACFALGSYAMTEPEVYPPDAVLAFLKTLTPFNMTRE